MMERICPCGCGASMGGLRADAVYASEACSKRARRAASPDKGRTGRKTDTDKLVELLLQNPNGVHTHDLRRMGISGNPSQRATDAEEKYGIKIDRVRESRNGRPGSRFTLAGEGGASSGESSALPSGEKERGGEDPRVRSEADPSASPEPLFLFGEGPKRPSMYDPDMGEAA